MGSIAVVFDSVGFVVVFKPPPSSDSQPARIRKSRPAVATGSIAEGFRETSGYGF